MLPPADFESTTSVPVVESTSCCRPGMGATGKAYGLDMADEMFELAEDNKRIGDLRTSSF